MFKNAGSEGMKDSDLILKSHKSSKTTKGIIVGYDPGLNVGIAILNLRGELISLESFKEIRRSEIITHIINFGNTVLVATDVYPVPKTVKKIASTLNSKIWSPYRNMSVESKIEIVDSYINTEDSVIVPQNAHERDALAAAVKTYKDHLKKFRQIVKRAKNLSLTEEMIDQVKIQVINGKSITNALRQISEENSPETNRIDVETENDHRSMDNHQNFSTKLVSDKKPRDMDISRDAKDITNEELTINRLKNKINSQKRYINDLREKNLFLEDEIKFRRLEVSKIQSKMDKLRNEYTRKILEKKELSSKISMIKRLQDKYSQEKALRIKIEKQLNTNSGKEKLALDAVPLKIIGLFTREGIRESFDSQKISKGDVVLLKNSEGGGSNTAAMICEMGVKAVITRDKISDPAENVFINYMIPLIPEDLIQIHCTTERKYVNSEELETQISNWLNKTKNQQKNDDQNKLINLMDEYRAQRRRELYK